MADDNIVYLARRRSPTAVASNKPRPEVVVTPEEFTCVETELGAFTVEMKDRNRPLPIGIREDGRIACPLNTLSLRTGISVSRLAIIIDAAVSRGSISVDYRCTEWDIQLCVLLDDTCRGPQW